MRRRLFAIVSAISLVMCEATCALWSRGYSHTDSFGWTESARIYQVEIYSNLGAFVFDRSDVPGEDHTGWETHDAKKDPVTAADYEWADDYAVRRRCGGFAVYDFEAGTGHYHTSCLILPQWSVALAFATMPLIWLIKGRPRVMAGHCARCGYDLRATRDRCPECGTVPNSAANQRN